MKAWRCPNCERTNSMMTENCIDCETPRPTPGAKTPYQAGGSLSCGVSGCGGVLTLDGLCRTANGYPEGFGVKIADGKWHSGPPTACGLCRGNLEWSGKCYRCWSAGQRTTVPGHEYLLTDGHWVIAKKGPRPIDDCGVPGCQKSLDEHKAEALKAIRAMLAAVIRD